MSEYRYIYFEILALFIFSIIIYLIDNYRKLSTSKYSFFIIFSLSISCIFIFMNRPVLLLTDTEIYVSNLHIYKSNILLGKAFEQSKDLAWDYFTLVCAYLDLTDKAFLAVCALLFISPLVLAFYKLFSRNMLLPFYLLFSCFFFYSLGTNILRAGIGFSFFVLAISYKDKIKPIFIFCAIAILFHLSFILPVSFFFLFYFFKIDIKYVIITWIVMLMISYLNISALNNIISLINGSEIQSRIESYMTTTSEYKIGFRYDFVLFSLFFGIIGIFLQKKVYSDSYYDQILKIYITSNAFFLLTMNIPYSDRFAILSWILIPIICSYPLIQANSKNWRIMIFGMSLFMLSLNFIIF